MGDIDVLDDASIDLELSGGADFGVDALASALSSGVKADVTATGNVQGALDVGLGNVRAEVGLNDIRVREIAPVRVQASIEELPLVRTESKVDLGLDDIRIRELPPVRFELSFRPLRVHLPLHYSFCLELFGIRLFKFSVCGEAMAIAEDHEPKQTERCP